MRSDDNKDLLLKAVVVGDRFNSDRPGKTALISKWVHSQFSQAYKSTIGVDFSLKVINWSADTLVRLQLWDIAGQERFGSMTRVYYRDAKIAFIVCDLNEKSTFESVQQWIKDLKKNIKDSELTTILILTNCASYAPNLLNKEEINKLVSDEGMDGWFAVDPSNLNEEPLKFAIGRYLEKSGPQKSIRTVPEVSTESESVALDSNSGDQAIPMKELSSGALLQQTSPVFSSAKAKSSDDAQTKTSLSFFTI